MFFFFKQKTAYEMRISDWSSDVCSSDLHERAMRIPFTNPRTGNELVERDGIYVDGATGQQVGAVVNGIPRFVEAENYAESFGFQWNTWEDTLSDTRSASDDKYRVILERTKFDQFDTEEIGRAHV